MKKEQREKYAMMMESRGNEPKKRADVSKQEKASVPVLAGPVDVICIAAILLDQGEIFETQSKTNRDEQDGKKETTTRVPREREVRWCRNGVPCPVAQVPLHRAKCV